MTRIRPNSPLPSPRMQPLLIGAVMLGISSCFLPGSQVRGFYINKPINLPSIKGLQRIHYVPEARYLLTTGVGSYANEQAMQLALQNKWQPAYAIWRRKDGEADCRWLNNIGIASSMLARDGEALSNLSRAYRLCPDNDYIRDNLRSVLDAGSRNRPHYRLHPQGSSRTDGGGLE